MVVFERIKLVGELKAKANLKEKEFIEYQRLAEIKKEERAKKEELLELARIKQRDKDNRKYNLKQERLKKKRIERERIEKTGEEMLYVEENSGWVINNPFLETGYDTDLTINQEESILKEKQAEEKKRLEELKFEEQRLIQITPLQMWSEDGSINEPNDNYYEEQRKTQLENIRQEMGFCSSFNEKQRAKNPANALKLIS